jgi:hypothetical protein
MTIIGSAARSPVVADVSQGARQPRATTHRDPERERTFLDAAARGHHPFVTQAQVRLEAGEELYGTSWAWIGVRRHLAELLEEAADLGSWAALADQALDHERDLSDVDRQRIAGVLAAAAEQGARAHAALTVAARALGMEATECP